MPGDAAFGDTFIGLLNSVGELVGSSNAVVPLLVLSILSFFITIVIVDVGASIAGVSPDPGALVLSAAVLAGAAIIPGATPLTAVAGSSEE